MRKRLTDTQLRNMRGKPGLRPEHPDGAGLYAVEHPTGRVVFAFRGAIGGRPFKLNLGRFPALTLLAARRRAAECAEMVAAGVDPRGMLGAKKELPASDLFEDCARDFITLYSRPRNRSWRQTARIFGLILDPQTGELVVRPGGLVDTWGKRPVTSFTRRELSDSIYATAARAPAMARLLRATLVKFFRWLVERGILTANPCADIPTPGVAVARDRVLDDVEVACLCRCCDELPEPYGRLFRFLLLTGARRGEGAGLTRAELNGDRTVWLLPAARSKNKVEHTVPLTPSARRQLVGDEGYLFSSTGRVPVRDFSRMKADLEARMRRELPDVAPFGLHDLRRTTASGMARLGVAPHIIESCLNHRSGEIRGVARTYNRFRYEAEKRAALELWARHVEALLEPKVVALPRRAERPAAGR